MRTDPRRINRSILIFISSWCLATAIAGAQTWDLASEFGTYPNQGTNGPSETWQYFYLSDGQRDGSYTPLTWFNTPWGGVAALQGWDNVELSDHSPCVVKNTSGSATAFGTASIPAGGIYLAPGVPPEWVAVAWRSAVSGIVGVNVGLTDIDPNVNDGVDWWLDKGGASGNLASGTLGAFSNQSTNVSVAGISVVPGDMIFLVMSPRGNVAYDNYQLEFTLTAIPEPSAVLSLLAAIPVAVWRFRRRRARGAV